jgi:hypothetical protein
MSIYAKCPNWADVRFYGRHWISDVRLVEELWRKQLRQRQAREKARARWGWLLVMLGCE